MLYVLYPCVLVSYPVVAFLLNFKGNNTIKDLLIAPRTRIHSLAKEVLFTDISVTIWDAQMSISLKLVGLWGQIQGTSKGPLPHI